MSYLDGNLLIASPQMPDSFFSKSVILVLSHTEHGAAGLIINRPTEATVTDLAKQIFQDPFDWQKPIWLGGPVSGPLVLLHREASYADHQVISGVYSTVEDSKVRQVLRLRLDPSLVIINYAGWGPGQLEREILESSWETVPASFSLIFPPENMDIWKHSLQQARAQKLLSLVNIREIPEDPSWN